MKDKVIEDLINKELERQQNTIELIASENIVSKDVLVAAGSILTNKYAEGKPYKRYYNGCDVIDKIEKICQQRCCKLFNVDHANVQPHSGASANMAVFLAVLNIGDTVLSMDLSNGGHLSHGSPVNFSGKNYNVIQYGINENGEIDYDEVEKLALEHKPKLIICGASNYSKIINFKYFADIRDKVRATGAECYLLADIAHIAGLIAGGIHPMAYDADFVTTTTHKSLRGPRGGVVMCKKEYADLIDKTIFPGMQGGPLEHIIAAKAVCFKEADSYEFQQYVNQVVENSKALCKRLIDQDIKVVGNMTENHLMTVNLTDKGITGKDAANLLEKVGITCNKNTVPNDPQSPFVTSGLRLGTCAVTTRGFDTSDMKEIGLIIASAIKHKDDEEVLYELKQRAKRLCEEHPIYRG